MRDCTSDGVLHVPASALCSGFSRAGFVCDAGTAAVAHLCKLMPNTCGRNGRFSPKVISPLTPESSATRKLSTNGLRGDLFLGADFWPRMLNSIMMADCVNYLGRTAPLGESSQLAKNRPVLAIRVWTVLLPNRQIRKIGLCIRTGPKRNLAARGA